MGGSGWLMCPSVFPELNSGDGNFGHLSHVRYSRVQVEWNQLSFLSLNLIRVPTRPYLYQNQAKKIGATLHRWALVTPLDPHSIISIILPVSSSAPWATR